MARLDPEEATGLALTLALVLIFGGGLVLAGLAIVVRATHGLAGVDSSVANWGDRHATAFSTHGLKLVTDLGETWMAVIAGVVVSLVETRRSRSRWVVPFLLAVMVGDKLLTETIKQLVDRVRPHLNPIAATLGPSFPSGHASTAAALWAAAALVAGRWWGRRAWPVLVALAVGIPVGVAASRVLLDVHWLTDVVAGLALGWARRMRRCTKRPGSAGAVIGPRNTESRRASALFAPLRPSGKTRWLTLDTWLTYAFPSKRRYRNRRRSLSLRTVAVANHSELRCINRSWTPPCTGHPEPPFDGTGTSFDALSR